MSLEQKPIKFNKGKTMEHQQHQEDTRLAKRLCYLLRYGAVKEGLHIYEGGYVDIDQVMELHLMRFDTKEEVIKEVETSLSHRGSLRFELKMENSKQLIRACFCRHFEQNPCHSGSRVRTLLDSCLEFVSSNLEMYDLEDFPDEFLINNMIHRLKRQKRLNNTTLRTLLVPALEHLDLDNTYVTEGTLKVIWNSCPHLRVLSLKDCGYLITDSIMEQTLKRLPELESVNLCACKHLTDRTIKAFCKRSKNLKQLNLSWIRTISEQSLIYLVQNCPTLEHLDIFDHRISDEGIQTFTDLAKNRNLTIVLKGLKDTEVAPDNPNALLPNFGKQFF